MICNSVEMINPLNEQVKLLVKREDFLQVEKPSLYIPQANREGDLTLKVLNSVNGINDMKSRRLLAKAKCMFSRRKRMIVITRENRKPEMHKLVLELTAVTFASKLAVFQRIS